MILVPVLIGGAAGATGRVATKLLLQMGFPVRAIARGDDERAPSLRALGAEIFVADLLDLCAVRHPVSTPSARREAQQL
jgi:NADPH:quinone reductase-like Zn-dependent oxidoreductase